MRVVVMGGGVVGVTTAYELLKDGHDVVLVERRADVGLDTSWGNAGMVAPGHSFAWSSPRAPWILLKSLFARNQALRFRPTADLRQWSWSLQFLAQCTEERAARNTLRKHKLAVYSQKVLGETVAAERIDYDRNQRGILYLYQDPALLEAGIRHMKILADDGQEVRALDRAQVLALDPALAGTSRKIAGGVYCPTDETGDCNKFTQALARVCQSRGMELRAGTTIRAIETDGTRVSGIATDKGRITADAYVLALGAYAPLLAGRIGLRLPIYPVKGYSLTVPIGNRTAPPTIASVDEERLVAITRMGNRVRVTSTAEFGGYDASHRPSDFDNMRSVVRELYPEGGDYDRAEMWAGLRPMTPDNLPVLGRRRHANLFVNAGHGHVGWTMSHGTGRMTADLIAGRRPALAGDLPGLAEAA